MVDCSAAVDVRHSAVVKHLNAVSRRCEFPVLIGPVSGGPSEGANFQSSLAQFRGDPHLDWNNGTKWTDTTENTTAFNM